MSYDIENFKRNMPIIDNDYGTLDVLGKTFGRYMDYKRETAMIEHATEKLKYQTDIIIKDIDSQLQKSLDSNKKNFKLEMKRLKVIAEDIKNNNKNEKAIIKHIGELRKQLSDPNIPIEIKETIPHLIALASQSFLEMLSKGSASIDAMSNFQSNQIEG